MRVWASVLVGYLMSINVRCRYWAWTVCGRAVRSDVLVRRILLVLAYYSDTDLRVRVLRVLVLLCRVLVSWVSLLTIVGFSDVISVGNVIRCIWA